MENSNEIKTLFEQNIHFLKLRYQIILAISEVIKIGKSTDGVRSKHLESLLVITKEWRDNHGSIKQNITEPITQVTFS